MDVRVCHDAVERHDVAGDDVGQLFVLADVHHSDQVLFTCDRVDLGHAVQVSDLRPELGDPCGLGVDEHERSRASSPTVACEWTAPGQGRGGPRRGRRRRSW